MPFFFFFLALIRVTNGSSLPPTCTAAGSTAHICFMGLSRLREHRPHRNRILPSFVGQWPWVERQNQPGIPSLSQCYNLAHQIYTKWRQGNKARYLFDLLSSKTLPKNACRCSDYLELYKDVKGLPDRELTRQLSDRHC